MTSTSTVFDVESQARTVGIIYFPAFHMCPAVEIDTQRAGNLRIYGLISAKFLFAKETLLKIQENIFGVIEKTQSNVKFFGKK